MSLRKIEQLQSGMPYEWTELKWKQMMFPDGQPHIELLEEPKLGEARITSSIGSALDVMEVLLVKSLFKHRKVHLDILYMLGARMDRPIDMRQPFTLEVIARMLASNGPFSTVRVLDPHSWMTEAQLLEQNVEVRGVTEVMPTYTVAKVLDGGRYDPSDTIIVAPDAGATPRVRKLLEVVDPEGTYTVVQGLKHRDSQTGNLSGFGVEEPQDVVGKKVLILDDICDGGGTFVGLAEELRECGATQVDLYVTHGIFSKGPILKGIDVIHTTDSFCKYGQHPGFILYKLEGLDDA